MSRSFWKFQYFFSHYGMALESLLDHVEVENCRQCESDIKLCFMFSFIFKRIKREQAQKKQQQLMVKKVFFFRGWWNEFGMNRKVNFYFQIFSISVHNFFNGPKSERNNYIISNFYSLISWNPTENMFTKSEFPWQFPHQCQLLRNGKKNLIFAMFSQGWNCW